ncbi:MAG: 4'-phosphopantetheinyl transferase superfamily protein [Ruminococcaceae bacterium]|nr:4'-phosphopantetheinyl transferase superfamily protein [Oscillospiraceae bacterium]
MRIFLCDAGNIPQDVLKKAASALPESRLPQKNMHADVFRTRVVGYLLAVYAAGQISPETVCENWAVTPNGKPYFEGSPVQFSISHTGTLVAVAVSKNHPVGLDIEKIRPLREKFAARYFSEREQTEFANSDDPDTTLIRLWTAKEAVGKYHGTGLSGDLREIDTANTTSAVFEKDGTRYALSIAPKGEIPPLEWVDFSNLVP